MPKRKNTSIKEYQLKSGAKRYFFRISLGTNSNGKRIVTTRRGFKSYAEAEDDFNKLAQTKADDFVKQKQIKLSDLTDLYLEKYRKTVKQASYYSREKAVHKHILRHFGNQYVDNITVIELQKWADNLAEELVNYRTIIDFLGNIFEYGMRLGYVDENPVKRILVPKKTTRKRRDVEHNVYSREELDTFLDRIKKTTTVRYIYFKLLASTGLRKSEALALTWQDVDLTNNTISVNKTLTGFIGSKSMLQKPKTKNSIRIVPISESLRADLIKYKLNRKIASNKVFCTYKGTYYSINEPARWLSLIYKDNPDLRKITVHGFRHTFATLLIEETDVKPKTVQMLLGHKNIQMTLDIYTHVNQKNKEDAVNALNQLNI